MVGREGLHQPLSFYLSQTPATQTPTAFVTGGGPRRNSCVGLALLDSVWPTVTITRGDICQPFFSQYIVMAQRGRSATGASKGRCLGRMARLISSLVHVALRFCRELLLCARFGTNLVRSNHPCLAPSALHQLPGEE